MLTKTPLIFSGSTNRSLVEEICSILQTSPAHIDVGQFSDGEISVKTQDHIRGDHVYICQSIGPFDGRPTDSALMETLLMADALRRAGARRITVVAPYLGYARQDKKDHWGNPIGSKVVAQMFQATGVNDLITLDIHAKQIQGFFDAHHTAPYDFYAMPVLRDDIKQRFDAPGLVIVSPDTGGTVRASALANELGLADIAIVRKYRPRANVSKVLGIIGDVEDRIAIMIDDMGDTLSTICGAARALIKEGALEVHAYCTHGVLSGNARHNLQKTPEVKSFTITNTLHRESLPEKVRVISIAPMLAGIIKTHFNNESFRELDVLQ